MAGPPRQKGLEGVSENRGLGTFGVSSGAAFSPRE